MAISQEAELYAPIKQFFVQQGYDVKAEVNHCDLVAIHQDSNEMIIVEMKKTFTLGLLLQGMERQRLGGTVYLAVERNRKKSGAVNQKFGDLSELCRRMDMGLIAVTFYKTKPPEIEVLCEPNDEPIRKYRPSKTRRLLHEFKERSGDYNVGGSQGKKLVTSYREKALRCALSLQQLGIASPKQIKEHSGVINVSNILRDNHYHWFHKVERGKYQLTNEGRHGLIEYQTVIEGWTNFSL